MHAVNSVSGRGNFPSSRTLKDLKEDKSQRRARGGVGGEGARHTLVTARARCCVGGRRVRARSGAGVGGGKGGRGVGRFQGGGGRRLSALRDGSTCSRGTGRGARAPPPLPTHAAAHCAWNENHARSVVLRSRFPRLRPQPALILGSCCLLAFSARVSFKSDIYIVRQKI